MVTDTVFNYLINLNLQIINVLNFNENNVTLKKKKTSMVSKRFKIFL